MQPYREVNSGKELCLFVIANGLLLAERKFDYSFALITNLRIGQNEAPAEIT